MKDTPEGQTHHCPHTTDGSICDMCLGKEEKVYSYNGLVYTEEKLKELLPLKLRKVDELIVYRNNSMECIKPRGVTMKEKLTTI